MSMRIIGCMSGTSLDGLDLALCEFWEDNGEPKFKIIFAKTYDYTDDWRNRLANAEHLSGLDLTKLDKDFGRLTSEFVERFINENKLEDIDYIASHGQTIFHQPERRITLQIGCGICIANNLKIPTINDFRSLDVELGGQGAPLVPIGDLLLFSGYDYCLNLGGFSNVSFNKDKERIAFDVSPANLALNYYANQLGHDYDFDGNLGRKGEVIEPLLSHLNSLEYYKKSHPKSLGKEWLVDVFLPLIPEDEDVLNVLRTIYEHIAIQIGRVLKRENTRTLVTGGGALNSFLMGRIKEHSDSEIIIPEEEVVNFKEALIFAFLGYLRINNRINVLKSVTGATRDSCSGVINEVN